MLLRKIYPKDANEPERLLSTNFIALLTRQLILFILRLKMELRFIAATIVCLVIFLWAGCLAKSREGPWLKKMNTNSADYRHVEMYCEGPQLTVARNLNETILATQAVIRHGDRGSIIATTQDPSFDCPFRKNFSLPSVWFEYSKAVSQAAEPHYVPAATGCVAGQLTSKGVIQELQLGAAVRQRFGADATNWNLTGSSVYYTNYTRTFQSALAFMYGLVPTFRQHSKNLHRQPPLEVTFCTLAGTCNCPAADSVRKQANTVEAILYQNNSNLFGNRVHDILSAHLIQAQVLQTVSEFDLLMQFACHGNRMPCLNNDCVTYADLSELITLVENVTVLESDAISVRQRSLIDGFGLLRVVADNLQAVVNGTGSKPFTLFTGHDTTIGPVLHALDLQYRSIIPYASFILFELFSVGTRNLFVRIIYNGEDVTRKTALAAQFDASSGLCPFTVFHQFVTRNLTSEFHRVCTL